MAGNKILITGATGHVGFRTLLEALDQGYLVRAAVRNESKIAQLKSATSLRPYLAQLSFTIVPDITSSVAFAEAIQGMDAVVHIASPIPKEEVKNYEDELMLPAIRGTTSILQAALQEPSLRRVIITSSSEATKDPNTTTGVYTADDIVPVPQGPFSHSFEAYGASKVAALAATRHFIAEHEPHFTIINIMPSFVVGKNELATTPDAVASGSNNLALAPLLGVNYPAPMPATMCHVDDVARVHVAALDPKLRGNLNLGVNYLGEPETEWNSSITIARKHFPQAVEQGIFTLDGSVKSLPNRFDASATEKKLGLTFQRQEEMVKSIASWYLEVHSSQAIESP